MDRKQRYPLRIEGLRKDTSASDVRRFLKCPSQDEVEIFSHGPTATAIAVLSQPDAACEFLNVKDPVIDGCRVTLMPELFEEMSITFNGSWLKEIEDESPAIQDEIRKIADKFNLRFDLQKSVYGDTKRISLTGVPWEIEQARAHLNDKIQAIIMNRSRNVVKRRWDETHFRPDVAGIWSPGNARSAQSGNEYDMQHGDDQRNHGVQNKVNKAVIRVEIDKHRYLVEHSTRLNFTDSSICQRKFPEPQIDWIIGGNNEKDLRRNEEELKRLIDKLLIKCYTAPTEIDFDIFQNQIGADNKNKDVTLIFDPKTRSCKVVGLLKDVEPTYKWIREISGELARGRQKPGRGSVSDASDRSRIFDR